MDEIKKTSPKSIKIPKAILKIVVIVMLGVIIYSIIDILSSKGIRSFYCLSKNRCVTVWKMENGEVYIIQGEYKIRKVPSNNYIKVTGVNYGYISVLLSKENRLLIDVEAEIIELPSNTNIELYRKNKLLNDSLYTYFDGKYRLYKKEVLSTGHERKLSVSAP